MMKPNSNSCTTFGGNPLASAAALAVLEALEAEKLIEAAEAFGADRRGAVCRELTKTHEEVRRGPLAELEVERTVRALAGRKPFRGLFRFRVEGLVDLDV